MSSFQANAQTGYFYNSKFIELEIDSTQKPRITPSISKKLKVSVSGKSKMYTSYVYHTEDVDNITILPKIILEIVPNADINEILSKQEETLNVYNNYNNTYYVNCDVSNSEEILNIVANIAKNPNVKWCEPDMCSTTGYNSNPLYNYQYYLHNTGEIYGTKGMDINAENAWKLITGSSNIKVAIIDTGIDLTHEDLKDALITGYTVGNPSGYGAIENPIRDYKWHGTACAGILAACDNNIGIKGVASGVKILPVNIAPYAADAIHGVNGWGESSEIAQAIRWAYPKADILNLSWGGAASNDIANAISEARNKGRNGKGCVVVAAVGNSNSAVSFPANLNGVIAVGAIDENGKICNFSNHGETLDLVAFGAHNIVTTDVMDYEGYTLEDYNKSFSGTSAACPQVAGVAALVLSANPELPEYRVKSILIDSARELNGTYKNDYYGYGLVNAGQAVAQAFVNKMQLTGPSTVENSAVYKVSNLPTGWYVTWSQTSCSSSITSSALMEPNYPLINEVTLRNSNGFAIKLTAKIHTPNDIVPAFEISRTITAPAPSLSGLYYEISPDGSKSYEMMLVDDIDGDVNYATPTNIVVITSNCFVNKQVSYTLSNESWNSHYVQIDGSRIQFEMPSLNNSQTMDFSIKDNGVTNYTFKFAALNSYTYQNIVHIEKIGNNIYSLSVNKLDDNNHCPKWNINVFNASNFEQVLSTEVKSSNYLLDLTSKKQGIYVINATINNHKISKKIVIYK